jgi:hypothetical protein
MPALLSELAKKGNQDIMWKRNVKKIALIGKGELALSEAEGSLSRGARLHGSPIT